MSAPISLPDNWSPPLYEKTEAEKAQIKESVQKIFFFQALGEKVCLSR
jgi:hypothetical protein